MLDFCARTQRKDREIIAFFSMERNWNLFHWVRLLTAQRKGKFISRRSDFYFPDRVLSAFYYLILTNYVVSLDFLLFPIKYVIFDTFGSDLEGLDWI